MKTCKSCRTAKKLDEFRRWNRGPDGRRDICRTCQCAQEKAWRDRTGKGAEYAQTFRKNNPLAYAITRCRQTATRKGLAFDLDRHVGALAIRAARGRCEISGYPFSTTGEPRRPDALSIDRIDCSQGYVFSNVRLVCAAVNASLATWGLVAVEPIIQTWASNIK
jgi:hypothetical protein